MLGFANLPGSELVDPPLTTMGYDRDQMGQLTITALLSLVQGKPAPGKIVVPAQFVARQSCAPPPAGDTGGGALHVASPVNTSTVRQAPQ